MRNKILILTSFVLLISCGDKPTKEAQVISSSTDSKEETMNTSNKSSDKKNILFFGDSLTAGYQLSEEQAYPYLIQQRIDSLGLKYNCINAGLSGETTAGGLNRIDWVLKQPVDIFLLELGANDVLRGLDLDQTEKNLNGIIEKVNTKYPEAEIIIVGMQAPPNMGSEYINQFNKIFPKLSKLHKAGLIKFLLEGVAGNPDLNLQDNIHPNVEGHKILTETVWSELKKYLS